MAKKKKVVIEKKKEAVFSKEQILKSEKITHSKDVLNAILKRDKKYSLEEVDNEVKKFKEKRVK